MLLIIDIGNTNTVLGIFNNKQLIECWRLNSGHSRTIDEYWITVKLLCDDAKISTNKISGIIISSVVPDLLIYFTEMAKKYFSIDPIIVSNKLDLGLEINVDEPDQLGADRLCNSVGAKAYNKNPTIIIDLGTATTFDVLDHKGNNIGGCIAPGMLTGSRELIRKAAQLHKIKLMYPRHIIGKTTTEQLQGGIFAGQIAMIEGIIKRIKKESGRDDFFTIVTGGLSTEITGYCDVIDKADLQLTLTGLRLIYEMNS